MEMALGRQRVLVFHVQDRAERPVKGSISTESTRGGRCSGSSIRSVWPTRTSR